MFGYPSWVYRATSSEDGRTYVLRRVDGEPKFRCYETRSIKIILGYRLTNERAIRTIQNWKRVINGNVVTVFEAFTNRSAFHDSALMIVTDYHPLSKTLAEIHFANSRPPNRGPVTPVTEQILWTYIVQIANALKTIHGAGLAARIIDATKILLTSKNHIRLNACGILDIVQFEEHRNIQDLQREDVAQFGLLMLSLGTSSAGTIHNMQKAIDQFNRTYSAPLRERVHWLLAMTSQNRVDTIDAFTATISGHILSAFDAQQHLNDQLNSEVNRELENSRIARLMMKLNFINERPEYGHDQQWAETGERYPIKLFRDYVFHQVDANGNPVMDMGHVLACLNKLDAGSDEKMVLESRDNQTVIVVSYKEIKRLVESAYSDLLRGPRR